ncbi:uncharacterized protein MELLADRAFT_76831 [Melampsora larici-populina 98AG31]|uniref:Dilute domain-containing protein n=1 Tax=Melampsora larici-populina (strain 98AG31 / pathotype 3-4-7) TaxID=747676 RepID=F4RAD7_MELLP|nr:uncharacterized protein MELLADRAFT_76831 [Melampsora larici-populina 98AG31]EGG10800.1 hypothetical protein MELLADRAFT_76831 [Melampsora larici-populina 98AG31]
MTEDQTINHQSPKKPSQELSSSSNHQNSSLIPDPSYIDPLIALAPTPINLSNLVHSIHLHSIQENQVKEVFNSAYLSAASSGDSDLIEWLLSKDHDHHHLTSIPNHLTRHPRHNLSNQSTSNLTHSILKPGEPRKYLNLNLTDQDGTPPIILAAAFGHPEAVRAIVDGIGGNVVDSRDSVGWTALHWAARNGDFTIVSYLLNHGATTNLVSYSESSMPPSSCQSSSISTHSRLSASSFSTLASDSLSYCEDQPSCPTTPTDTPSKRTRRFRGLRPYDLAKRGPEGDDIRHILRMAEEAKADALLKSQDQQSNPSRSSRPPSLASMKSPRPPSAARQAQLQAHQSQSNQLRELASLAAKTLDLNFNLFGFPSTSTDNEPASHLNSSSLFLSTLSSHTSHHLNNLQNSNSIEAWEQEQRSEEFDWDQCLPDQMLVCSIDELPIIFDAVISSMEPKRSRNHRFVPSNVIFLCARFAAHFGTEDLLEELILGALDQIEDVVLAREDSMANSAFWLFNCCTLLYYLKREPHLNSVSKEFQVHLQDLINLIFVLVIRNAERRLDKVLDSSMLDFQPLPGFEHVEFEPEGSWRFVKALTVKRSRQTSLKPSLSSFLVGSPRSPPSSGSAQQTPNKTPTHLRSSSHQVSSPNTTPLKSNHLNPNNQSIGPRAITDLLSSVLYVLQSYELHSSLIVQAFSQLFYWLGCELFNRIITRRKYLCRSKAMEIRLNVNVIEEWSRHNRLPNRLIQEYFKPLNSMLKWLQSISNEQVQDMNKLICVINELNPSSLNPVQMLKSLKDYRYEIEETKMTEEGRTYLVKLQQDWDKKRLSRKEELEEREKAEEEMMGAHQGNGNGYNGLEGLVRAEVIEDNAVKAIDEGLMDESQFESYLPPASPECLGELLDSRYMLPFGLPTLTESLFLEYDEEQPKNSLTLEFEEEEEEEMEEMEEETEESLKEKEMEKIRECKKSVLAVPVLDSKVLNRLDTFREKHRKLKTY